jgi:hypothetical protein
MGMEIDPHSPVHRRRLRWPTNPDPPPGKRQSEFASVSRSADQLHQTVQAIVNIYGRSIGTLTALPYSVHEPS